jgi:hypothetical protein
MSTSFLSFNLRDNAEKFIGALLDHGAKPEDISVIARESGYELDASEVERAAASGITTTTAADFTKGAVIGGTAGLGLGIAAGLAALFIPGIGLVAGGGALASALAGAATATASGALAGGIAGYMRDMGIEGETPDYFEQDFADDYIIVAVQIRPDGLPLQDIVNLADKYHATRSTLQREAIAAVPVVEQRVAAVVTEPQPGIAAVETVVVEEPVCVQNVPAVVEQDVEPTRPSERTSLL